jgi:hypothetical protein
MSEKMTVLSVLKFVTPWINLNNIYLENNQKIQYIKHSKYRHEFVQTWIETNFEILVGLLFPLSVS